MSGTAVKPEPKPGKFAIDDWVTGATSSRLPMVDGWCGQIVGLSYLWTQGWRYMVKVAYHDGTDGLLMRFEPELERATMCAECAMRPVIINDYLCEPCRADRT